MLKTFEHATKKPSLFLVRGDLTDPELITLKGRKALLNARVVLYDASIHMQLLNEVSAGCRLVNISDFVNTGEAHRITVFYTFRYGIAVRLHSDGLLNLDQAEYARRKGIHTDIIAGIPATLSIPVAYGIPPTCRGVNESLWMAPDAITPDQITWQNLACAARSGAAVILKTRPENIQAISKLFISIRGDQEPAAMLTECKSIKGTVSSISESCSHDMDRCVILVIGKIASGKLDFSVHPAFNLAI